MNHRISWISPFQTAYTSVVIGAVLSIPAFGIMWIFNQFATRPGNVNWPAAAILMIAISILFAVFSTLAVISYNIAARFGLGISIQVKAKSTDSGQNSQLN